jgi:DNA-binding GntR family transcriptional regulator
MLKSADKVYQTLRSMILSGELAQGAPLREEEVAELCGVSRTPVRDAMRQLEAEMFIRRSESQRSFVAEWTLEDLEEVFTLRSILESYAARRAAERATAQGIAKLMEVNELVRSETSGVKLNVNAFLAGNGVFHSLVLEMAASERLATLLNRLILQPIVQRTALRYDRIQLEQSLSEHEELATALSRRDPDWAASVMTAHIRRAYHVYIDRVTNNAVDEPIPADTSEETRASRGAKR